MAKKLNIVTDRTTDGANPATKAKSHKLVMITINLVEFPS